MMTDSLEHQLPIDTVEIALDIKIEHPVVPPAPLASRPNGINR